MKRYLVIALLAVVCLAAGVMVAFLLFGREAGSSSDGFVVVNKLQAVAPQYQPAPVRISCPANNDTDKELCDQATSFVKQGGSIASTRMRCMPGSPAFQVSGEISGRRFEARFDCNRTNREGLRKAAEAAFAAQAVTRSYKQSGS